VAALFLGGILTIFTQRRHRLLALALAVPALVGLATGYALPGLPRVPLSVAIHLSATAFFGYAILAILNAIYREERLTIASIPGALCGYVLIAIAFAHLYGVLELTTPGSFRASDENLAREDQEQLHFQLIYFSLVTLTTLGYGDIVPARNGARSLAVVEAIL